MEGKRSLGRPKRRWVNNIRMDPQEVGCRYMDWIGLAQDRDRWRTIVSAVMNRRVPWNAGNFLTGCKPVSCSGRTLHHGVSKQVKLRNFPSFSWNSVKPPRTAIHLSALIEIFECEGCEEIRFIFIIYFIIYINYYNISLDAVTRLKAERRISRTDRKATGERSN